MSYAPAAGAVPPPGMGAAKSHKTDENPRGHERDGPKHPEAGTIEHHSAIL